jgi:hypothetical protein
MMIHYLYSNDGPFLLLFGSYSFLQPFIIG